MRAQHVGWQLMMIMTAMAMTTMMMMLWMMMSMVMMCRWDVLFNVGCVLFCFGQGGSRPTLRKQFG